MLFRLPVPVLRFFFVTDSTLLFLRPPNVAQSVLHPSSFHNQFPRRMSVLVWPRLVGLPSEHSLDWLQPLSFFQLLTVVLVSHRFQWTIPACFSTIIITSCEATCPSSSKVCYFGHLMRRSRVSHMTARASSLTEDSIF